MNILFYDRLQESDAPKQLISSSLADYYAYSGQFTITLNSNAPINAVGLGNTNAESFFITLVNQFGYSYPVQEINPDGNGLYLLNGEYQAIKQIIINPTGSYVGRLAVGKAVNLRTSIPKEPTLVSTKSPRVTLSGQVIEGLGGYDYWRVSLDTRYKINQEKMDQIIRGFPSLSKGLPIFVSFEDEKDRLPFNRLYANDTNQQEMSFESSINKPLFSRRFIFQERF
jgi:hypothetical protein